MRKMTQFIFGAIVAAQLVGCGGNACEKAGDRMLAKLEECGVSTTGTGTSGDAECTDEAAALAECYADCTEAADCSVVAGTGTDLDALLDYASCFGGCLGTGTTGTTTTGS